MKLAVAIIAIATLAVAPTKADPVAYGETVGTASLTPAYADANVPSPTFDKFVVSLTFNYNIANGAQIVTAPSGPQLTPAEPPGISIDFLAPPFATQTIQITTQAGATVTLSGADIVNAFATFIQTDRSGAPPAK